MKNPCDNCLIKVNCTAVCFEKENYKSLLNNAVLQSNIRPKNYYTYSTMLFNTMTDEFNIKQRGQKALNP